MDALFPKKLLAFFESRARFMSIAGGLALLLAVFSFRDFSAGSGSVEYVLFIAFQGSCLLVAGAIFTAQFFQKQRGFTSEIHSGWVFTIVALLCLYWLPLGFDVTDEGRRLSLSRFLFQHGKAYPAGFKLGSHLAYFFWLKALPIPLLLWSRLGFLVLHAAIATLLFRIVREYTAHRWAFMAAVVVGFTTSIYVVQTVNYNNFPVFLLLLSARQLQVALLKGGWNKHFLFFGMGLGAVIVSRFPLVVLLPFPLLFLLTHGGLFTSIKLAFRQLLLTYLGSVLILGLFAGFLQWNGTLDNSIRSIELTLIKPYLKGEANQTLTYHFHDRKTLESIYTKNLRQLWDYLQLTGWPFLAIVPLFFLRLRLLSIVLCLALMVYWLSIVDARHWADAILAPTALLFVLLLFHRGIDKRSILPLFWGLVITTFCFVGSNFGIRNMVMSGGVGLLLAFVIASLSDSNKSGRLPSHGLKTLSLFTAVMLLTLTWNYKKQFIYRDLDEGALTTMFQSPALFGIFSHKERVTATDELLDFASKNHLSESYQNLLCVNTVPMFNYLLDIPPGEYIYWKLTSWTPEEKDSFFLSDSAPELLVISYVNVRSRDWPADTSACHHSDLPFYRYYEQMLDQSRESPYQLLFSNDVFGLYEKRSLKTARVDQ